MNRTMMASVALGAITGKILDRSRRQSRTCRQMRCRLSRSKAAPEVGLDGTQSDLAVASLLPFTRLGCKSPSGDGVVFDTFAI